ncbi:hypothetical protein Athai_20870 [Actinocatenispora thailandica]|uniref:Secreted protein n=1 Tax=Actinocatenispora thailandica TaxID=227318 RepID=A0A7R7DMQ7_9ACTN|nr:hypothetical protein [Actinocatenispora thailandica]BCJ34584.1 hypothetical protein Athai_20870 [Actinocatenispora thailandica]
MTITRRTLLQGLAVTPVAAALGTAASPGAASAADPVDPNPEKYTVKHRTTTTVGTTAPYTQVIDDIRTLGGLPYAAVSTVLASANRTGFAITTSGFPADWRWQSGDDGDPNWVPQGITTSADYHDDGLFGGRQVILISWYDHANPSDGKGVRISFVDMADPNAPTYRHVLLVEPYYEANGGAGLPNYRAVNVHAGGIMWYGDLLYVVDTGKGIRVFDTTRIMKVTATGDKTTIGHQADGTYTAHNYAYVLPQTAAYDSQQTIQWSCISLDRSSTPDSIVVAEWASNGDGKRVFAWDIDYTTRLLKTGSDGLAHASFAATPSIDDVQGVTRIGPKFFFSRSNGTRGDVVTWVPGNLVHIDSSLPYCEDLSYDHNSGWLWTLKESPTDARIVYAQAAADLA